MLDVCLYLSVIIFGCIGLLVLIGWITGPDDEEIRHEEELRHEGAVRRTK